MLRTIASKPGAAGRGVLARPLYALPGPVHATGTPRPTRRAGRVRAPGPLLLQDTPELDARRRRPPAADALTFDSAAGRCSSVRARAAQERRELVRRRCRQRGPLPRLALQARRPDRPPRRRPARAANWTAAMGRRDHDRRADRRPRDRACAVLPRARAPRVRPDGGAPEQRSPCDPPLARSHCRGRARADRPRSAPLARQGTRRRPRCARADAARGARLRAPRQAAPGPWVWASERARAREPANPESLRIT